MTQSNTIYSDSKRTITASDNGLNITTSAGRNIPLAWSSIIGVADKVTHAKTLSDMRYAQVAASTVFALRLQLGSLSRELAIPTAARQAIESAIADYNSRKTEIEARKARESADAEILTANTGTIYLSSRGWGDYSSLDWTGDLRRSDSEILAECKHLLATGHDVDKPNQTDEQILAKIASARQHLADAPRRQKEAEDFDNRDMGAGYCFYCGSFCSGDCGHYQPKRTITAVHADESNYGING